jgi:hypothetical protein
MKTTLYAVAAIVALAIAVVGGRSSSAQDKRQAGQVHAADTGRACVL